MRVDKGSTANPQKVMSSVQFLNKYSLYNHDLGRRETWEETVARVVSYLKEVGGKVIPEATYEELYRAILLHEVSPSMRLMATAGKGARRNQISIYNCSYLPLQDTEDFHDLAMLLGHGVGVGFSVENEYVSRWPKLDTIYKGTYTVVVPDNIEGWAMSFKLLLDNYYNGYKTIFDYSKIRPAGSPLLTRGGHASGPESLRVAHENIEEVLNNRAGLGLRSIDLLDIACYVAQCIVSGGVRRCLPEGSMVHTKEGMKPIEAVAQGDMVLTSEGYHKVLRKFEQGEQKLVRVVTQDSSFECTPNHRIAVLNGQDTYGWKMASELVPGDRLIAPSVGILGSKQSLPSFSYEKPANSTTCRDIVIPELDEKMAWLLGLLHGDGHIRLTSKAGEVTIPFANDQVEMAKVAIGQLERFGVNCHIAEHENYFVVRTKSKQLATYFHSWLKQANTSIEIPSFIWSAEQSIKLAYISGVMDADGSAKTRPVQIAVTVYEEFAKQLQVLLSSCGVQARVKPLSVANLEDGWRPKFGVVLINSKSKEVVKNIPTLFKNYFSNTFMTERCTNSYPHGFCEYPNKAWSNTDNKLIPVTFLGLEEVIEEQPTWDLEIEGKHEFFCNGYLVHNSAMIAVFDKDDSLMLEAKSGDWWMRNLQRSLVNISQVVTEHMEESEWLDYLMLMDKNKSGEPGIWSRYAIEHVLPERRQHVKGFGPNPLSVVA